ncbi:MAG: sigma-70 family RNA polymerase sigma factor [Flavobacteriaceae bacterium]|nr:sigma-70 family RNA polymerase sigma factor [Flavobacteriales bacterium]MDP4665769.1 sigma-70 family RNA polymerase sigma factor [Flavobacteriaceae bacterium]
MPESDLRDLINGCVRGKRKSQEELFKRYYSKMMIVSMRYTKNADEAADILQDGFLKVFAKLEAYNFEGSFEGWIRRIIANTAIDQLRKRKNDFILLQEDQSLEDFAELIEDDTEEDELEFKPDQVLAAMHELSPAYRTIFNLYVFENLTHKEIADKLDISVGTSKSNLAKAKRNLAKILRNGTY